MYTQFQNWCFRTGGDIPPFVLFCDIGSQLCPLRHLTMSVETLSCHTWGLGATGVEWVETREAAKHSTMSRIVLHNKELSDSKMSIILGIKSTILRGKYICKGWDSLNTESESTASCHLPGSRVLADGTLCLVIKCTHKNPLVFCRIQRHNEGCHYCASDSYTEQTYYLPVMKDF